MKRAQPPTVLIAFRAPRSIQRRLKLARRRAQFGPLTLNNPPSATKIILDALDKHLPKEGEK